MATVLVPSLLVTDSVEVRRVRELPLHGRILVQRGETVREDQIVAEADIPGEMRIVRVAEELGVGIDEALKALRIKEGDVITHGQIIAERAGLFGWFVTRVLAPLAGTVELVSKETAHIAIRDRSTLLSMNAYVRGVVDEVMNDRTIVIRAEIACVQGIFGVGGERSGIIHMLDLEPSTLLRAHHLEHVPPGSIVVGGCQPDIAALKEAERRGVRGLIVGSLDDRMLRDYLGYELGIALTGDEEVAVTVIMTEGFGELPIAAHTRELLHRAHGCAASINGATQVRAGAIRPEILIFDLPIRERTQRNALAELRCGTRVRIIRVPYFGEYGEVVELPEKLEKIPSGGYTRVARVETSKFGIVTVPRANIELL